VSVKQSDIVLNVPLPVPPGIICFWKKTRATIPSGWGLCDGLWYDPRDLTPGQVGQAGTDATHTVQTDNLLNKLIACAGDIYAQGDTGGAATVTLAAAEMPSHVHAGPVHLHPAGTLTIPEYDNWTGTGGYGAIGGNDTSVNRNISVAGNTGNNAAADTGAAGSGNAHNNMPPYRAEYPIEKL
jgi:microcystin-dependent protein